jgi:hypothetical protein
VTPELQAILREELRGLDGDLYLCHLFAPADKRPGLLALYHAHADIARIPYEVSDAMLAAIRLQWWRDMFDMTARGEIPDAPIGRALQAARLRIEDLHELVDAREAFIAEDGDKGEAAARAGRALMMLALEIFNLDAAVLGELAAQGGEGFERLRATPDETSISLCRDLLNAACLGFNRLPAKQRKAALPVFLPIGMARRQARVWPHRKSLLSYQLHLLKMALTGRL